MLRSSLCSHIHCVLAEAVSLDLVVVIASWLGFADALLVALDDGLMLLAEDRSLEGIEAHTEFVESLLDLLLLLVHHSPCFAEARDIACDAVIDVFIDRLDVIAESCLEEVNKL